MKFRALYSVFIKKKEDYGDCFLSIFFYMLREKKLKKKEKKIFFDSF